MRVTRVTAASPTSSAQREQTNAPTVADKAFSILCSASDAMRLLGAKCLERVDACRAPCRHVAGDEGDSCQYTGRRNKRESIGRSDTEKERVEQPGRRVRCQTPDGETERGLRHAGSNNQGN